MGEKDFMEGFSGLLISGGKIVGLTHAEFVNSEGENICKEGPVIEFQGTQTASFQTTCRISRTGYYTFLVGPWPRMIRRAIRWEEKLRRMGIPPEDRRFQAADKARYSGNNGKHPKVKWEVGWVE